MNLQEFSREFDILYDNVTSGKAPGFNEYEKSVFLTKAQDQLLKNYFNPLGNKYQAGYSQNTKRTVDFSNIIRSTVIEGTVAIESTYRNTMVYDVPKDILFPTGLVLRNSSGKELQVVHVSEVELTRLFRKPYKQPYKGEAYKIDNMTEDRQYEIIVGKVGIEGGYSLYLRYVKIPKPIILMDLEELEKNMGLPEDFLSINGVRKESECELHDSIHYEILDRAVNLAKVHYETTPEAIIQYSTNNE